MLDRLDPSIDDVVWSMLDATCFGNKVAELVSVLERDDGPGGARTWLRIRAIKPEPRQSVAFVVEQFMNLVGFLGATPGQATPSTGSPLKPGDPAILPRDKFAVLSWRPRDCDPRGTSILRPAYEAWWRKRQMFPEYLKYLTQFAGPSLWGSPPADALPASVADPLDALAPVPVDVPEDATPALLGPQDSSWPRWSTSTTGPRCRSRPGPRSTRSSCRATARRSWRPSARPTTRSPTRS
jgi:hypothetical protein